jgi:hypothetical protein
MISPQPHTDGSGVSFRYHDGLIAFMPLEKLTSLPEQNFRIIGLGSRHPLAGNNYSKSGSRQQESNNAISQKHRECLSEQGADVIVRLLGSVAQLRHKAAALTTEL